MRTTLDGVYSVPPSDDNHLPFSLTMSGTRLGASVPALMGALRSAYALETQCRSASECRG